MRYEANCNTCKYRGEIEGSTLIRCGMFKGKEAEHIAAGNIILGVGDIDTPPVKVQGRWPVEFDSKTLQYCTLYKELKQQLPG